MNLFKNLTRRKSLSDIQRQMDEGVGDGHAKLCRTLTVRDLTALGIAAIVGAGIFSTVGKACFDGGPGVIFLFLMVAVACGFSALCYAEFASRIPVAGSAYTYSYASFGELVAWIIGWDLIMEYAIGNMTVAISWSSNLNSFLNNIGINIPGFLSTGYFTALKGYHQFNELALQAKPVNDEVRWLNDLWLHAPRIGGIPFIINLPALLITAIITYIVYIGIKESRTSSNLMVAFKLVVILLVIAIGFFFVNPQNWKPFVPNGFGGIMKGVSAVFFAYIGFDAISTTAEECKNPQKDLPRGMLYSLILCTVLYVLVALVLTGMVKYDQLNVGDFLANAFNTRGLKWMGGAIAISAVIATSSVLLVFQIGQPRIWLSMSRDGLLPKPFARIHPKHQTPSFSTIITGLFVGIPSLVLDSDFVTDLTSIGTLFAFVLVCGGIIINNRLIIKNGQPSATKFKVPYINGRFIVPLILLLGALLAWKVNADGIRDFWGMGENAPSFWNWHNFSQKIPMLLFLLIAVIISLLSFRHKYSLIPVLGMMSCFYLMTELGYTNWLRFGIWLIIGLVIYFSYSYRNSRIGKQLSN